MSDKFACWFGDFIEMILRNWLDLYCSKLIKQKQHLAKHTHHCWLTSTKLCFIETADISNKQSDSQKLFHVSFPFRMWLLCVITIEVGFIFMFSPCTRAILGGLESNYFQFVCQTKVLRWMGAITLEENPIPIWLLSGSQKEALAFPLPLPSAYGKHYFQSRP